MVARDLGASALAVVLASLLALAVPDAATAQVATLEGSDGGSAASPAPDPTASPSVLDREEALLDYAECMRDNGIDMADPQPGTGGGRGFFRAPGDLDVESEKFEAAQTACAAILEAARPELDPEAQAERLEEMLALAQCMRDHGIDGYPDPVMGGDGRIERIGRVTVDELGFDPRSEEFQAAREACLAELGMELGPGGGPGPGLGGPGPGTGGAGG